MSTAAPPPPPKTVAELIDLWPSGAEFARDLGLLRESHAGVMKLRGVVHVRHWPRLIAKAAERGIPGITADRLMRLHVRDGPEGEEEEGAGETLAA